MSTESTGESFYDPTTMDFMAQEASGGPCSLAVIDVIELASQMPVTSHLSERYDSVSDPECGGLGVPDFVDLGPRKPSFGTFMKAFVGIFPERIDRSFRGMTRPVTLKTGVDVELGMHAGTLGALTRDGTFVPLVDFNDARNRDDLMCSTATLRHGVLLAADGVNEISTVIDERVPVVSKADGYRLAINVVRDIVSLQADAVPGKEPKTVEEQTTHDQAVSRLIDCLAVDMAVEHALKLDPRQGYAHEQALRSRVSIVVRNLPRYRGDLPKAPVTILEDNREYEENPSRNHTLRTSLDLSDLDGGPVIAQDFLSWNGRPDRKEMMTARLRLGRRIGQAVLEYCIEKDETAEGFAEKLVAALDQAGETDHHIRGLEEPVDAQQNPQSYQYTEDSSERITHGFGLERSTVWFELTEEERDMSKIYTTELAAKFGLRQADFRVVKAVCGDTSQYVVVYAGQTGLIGKKYVKAALSVGYDPDKKKLKQTGPGWMHMFHGPTVSTQYYMSEDVYKALCMQMLCEAPDGKTLPGPTMVPSFRIVGGNSLYGKYMEVVFARKNGEYSSQYDDINIFVPERKQFRPAVLVAHRNSPDSESALSREPGQPGIIDVEFGEDGEEG